MVVIDGGCPLMFGPTADGGHKVMCALLKLTGKVPRHVCRVQASGTWRLGLGPGDAVPSCALTASAMVSK